ncbi:MAG: acyl-ACP--UDP-N-acetylglucosamine O-acyltransferase [Candidatus Omnitrophica bacterium]|nr:acyl-ACP--UDP-N-acetylglucosamine O-acyltransferase [Candidatus Omnitrophota bacterium]
MRGVGERSREETEEHMEDRQNQDIHPTAVIEEGARLGSGVSVGPYAVIEAGVRLDDDVSIGPHAHVKGRTRVGAGTTIGTGAQLGERPQMRKNEPVPGNLEIGRGNVIREYVTIHVSTSPETATRIGDDNFLMGFSHVAHDCQLGDSITMCNGTLVAGHAQIESRAFLSGNVTVHQFVRIGQLAMIGGLARVNQDVPPYMMIVGDSRVWGLNVVGLRRAGVSREEMKLLKKAHAVLYRRGLSPRHAREELRKMDSPLIHSLSRFLDESRRGVCGPRKGTLWETLFLEYPYFVRTAVPAYRHFLRGERRT